MKTVYIAAVEHEDATSYSVEFPDLPGCFSAAANYLHRAHRPSAKPCSALKD